MDAANSKQTVQEEEGIPVDHRYDGVDSTSLEDTAIEGTTLEAEGALDDEKNVSLPPPSPIMLQQHSQMILALTQNESSDGDDDDVDILFSNDQVEDVDNNKINMLPTTMKEESNSKIDDVKVSDHGEERKMKMKTDDGLQDTAKHLQEEQKQKGSSTKENKLSLLSSGDKNEEGYDEDDDLVMGIIAKTGTAAGADATASATRSYSTPGAFRQTSGPYGSSTIQASADDIDLSEPFTTAKQPSTTNGADGDGNGNGEEEDAVTAATFDTSSLVVKAVKVMEGDEDNEPEEAVEERVRQRIIQQAVQADVVDTSSSPKGGDESRDQHPSYQKLLVPCLIVCVIGLAIGLGIGLSSASSSSSMNDSTTPSYNVTDQNGGVLDDNDVVVTPPTTSPSSFNSTYDDVMSRGYVLCGVYDEMPGFAFRNQTDGTYSGINVELCRAVAAAALDDPDKVEYVLVSAANRFSMLASGQIDLISQTVTSTMERDVNEKTSGTGLTFSYPFYFSGLVFGGLPEFVECADRLDPFTGICRQLKVCVVIGTTQDAILNSLIGGSAVVRFETPTDAIEFMNDGTCNAIAAEAITLNPTRLRQLGLFQDMNFTLGKNTFSRDPLALTTRDGDIAWSDLVNSVVKILLSGEALNLTKDNVEDRIQEYRGHVDEQFLTRIVRVISTIGNYRELYETEVDNIVERQGANVLNIGADSGLVYSYPFGDVFREGNGIGSDVMESIRDRGFVNCGISLEDDLFAMYDEGTDIYAGIDVEYCRALAAGIFVGDSNLVEFTVLNATNAFTALSSGSVDVLAGQQITLANEFSEPTSGGKSFSFSEPYFRATDGTTRALVTRRDDDLWSSFVYWTLTALVFAEETGITSSSAIDVPPVSLYGEDLLQSFRDSVAAVGNYGEIYNRTMGTFLSRSGANQLNTVPYGPQQVGYPIV